MPTEASRCHGRGKKAGWDRGQLEGLLDLVPGWAPLGLASENTGLVSPDLLVF